MMNSDLYYTYNWGNASNMFQKNITEKNAQHSLDMLFNTRYALSIQSNKTNKSIICIPHMMDCDTWALTKLTLQSTPFKIFENNEGIEILIFFCSTSSIWRIVPISDVSYYLDELENITINGDELSQRVVYHALWTGNRYGYIKNDNPNKLFLIGKAFRGHTNSYKYVVRSNNKTTTDIPSVFTNWKQLNNLDVLGDNNITTDMNIQPISKGVLIVYNNNVFTVNTPRYKQYIELVLPKVCLESPQNLIHMYLETRRRNDTETNDVVTLLNIPRYEQYVSYYLETVTLFIYNTFMQIWCPMTGNKCNGSNYELSLVANKGFLKTIFYKCRQVCSKKRQLIKMNVSQILKELKWYQIMQLVRETNVLYNLSNTTMTNMTNI